MILFFEPYFSIKPWAGNELTNIYDCPNNTGEAWIISGFNKKSSVVKNGEFKGQTLRHIWNMHPELFGEDNEKEFPILIKLISTKDSLSVQVHPNDDYALKKSNSLGKFECWYILPETKASNIILGIDVKNATELKKIIDDSLIENFLIKKEIHPHDLIVIEPGRVHAISGETFILEIQESSDITYRLYDFNRLPKRELNIDDALKVINYNNKGNPIFNFSNCDTYRNKHFTLYKLIIKGKMKYENKGFEIFYVISGFGRILDYDIKKGDSFIMTNQKDSFFIEGDLEIIAVIPKQKSKERLAMRKVAFITGIVGQDGAYLSELLLEKNYEVHGLIQATSQLDNDSLFGFLQNKDLIDRQIFFHVGDLTDSSNINRLLEKIKPDEIYHLASQSHVDLSFDMPEYTTLVNSLGTLRLLDAIKNSEIKSKIFCLSSPYLFDGEVYPQNEKTRFNPNSPYAISKEFAYNMVKSYRNNYSIFAVNGILYNHESPKRDNSFVSKKIVNYVLKYKANLNNNTLKLGNLDSKREWGHSIDYCYAMWLMLQQDIADDFVVSTGEAYTIREFVEKAFKKIGVDIIWIGNGIDEKGYNKNNHDLIVEVDPHLIRPIDANVLVGDSRKFRQKTGWKPKYTFDNLLDSLIGGIK